MSPTALFSAPLYVWRLYVEYLWNYKSGSWVERTASTFRVMAFLVIAPFVILTMLDVASYVIARTLGVIDATKASTSGAAPHETAPSGGAGVPATRVDLPMKESQSDGPSATPPFLRENDNVVAEGNLRLAGIEVFSPAPSAPPSPTLSRRDLTLPRLRPLTTLSKLDPSEESFGNKSPTIGEDSGSEESGEGVQVRRRTRRVVCEEEPDA